MNVLRSRREGIALLELVTALVIISIGLLGVVQMYQIGIGKIRESQRRTIALHAIDNEIETLRALPSTEFSAGRELPWRSDVAPLDVLQDAHTSLDVEPFEGHSPLLKVVARLRWREGRHMIQREVTTLMGARP